MDQITHQWLLVVAGGVVVISDPELGGGTRAERRGHGRGGGRETDLPEVLLKVQKQYAEGERQTWENQKTIRQHLYLRRSHAGQWEAPTRSEGQSSREKVFG